MLYLVTRSMILYLVTQSMLLYLPYLVSLSMLTTGFSSILAVSCSTMPLSLLVSLSRVESVNDILRKEKRERGEERQLDFFSI